MKKRRIRCYRFTVSYIYNICPNIYRVYETLPPSPFSHILFCIGSRLKGEDSNDVKGRRRGKGEGGKVGSVGGLFVGAKASQA